MAETRNILLQIAEIERELAMRQNVYPGWVGRGKMRQGEADEHMARMRAVLATLIWCRDHRDALSETVRRQNPLAILPNESGQP